MRATTAYWGPIGWEGQFGGSLPVPAGWGARVPSVSTLVVNRCPSEIRSISMATESNACSILASRSRISPNSMGEAGGSGAPAEYEAGDRNEGATDDCKTSDSRDHLKGHRTDGGG